MCGIVGAVAARGAAPPSGDRVERATRALAHRGPDGSAVHVADGVALGHTRLSIVDLVHGDQPIWNEDGTVLTIFNGEIWNFPELRGELERAGHTFATDADTEVLVHGYEELPPAPLVTYDRAVVRVEPFWRLEPRQTEPLEPEELRSLLLDA